MAKNGKKIVPTLPLGIYIHIPFCEQKCPYCDFYSVTTCDKKGRYLKALEVQIKEYGAISSCYKVDTVFIGGGTPSILEPSELKGIVKAIKKNFNMAENMEMTVESNPNSLTLRKLRAMRKMGINRLSVGVQSYNDSELQSLGRIHTAEQAENAIKLATKAKFKNINIDLMFALPEQRLENFKKNLHSAVLSGATHISAYGLKVEEGTPFWDRIESLGLPNDDEWADMYDMLIEELSSHGYSQYEVSNFAKSSYECRHNLKYWTLSEYLGLGAGAHSFFGNRRFSFVSNIDKYCDIIEGKSRERPTDEYFEISSKDAVSDYIMLGMRLVQGIDTEVFARMFNRDFETFVGPALQKYIDSGHIKASLHNYSFTTKGFCISNYILADLINNF